VFTSDVLEIRAVPAWPMSYVEPYGKSDLTDIQAQLFHLGGSDTVRGYALGRWAFPPFPATLEDK